MNHQTQMKNNSDSPVRESDFTGAAIPPVKKNRSEPSDAAGVPLLSEQYPGGFFILNEEFFELENRPEGFTYRTILLYTAIVSHGRAEKIGNGYRRRPCTASVGTLMRLAGIKDETAFRKHREILQKMDLIRVPSNRFSLNRTRRFNVSPPTGEKWVPVPHDILTDSQFTLTERAVWIAVNSFGTHAPPTWVKESHADIVHVAGLRSTKTVKTAFEGLCRKGAMTDGSRGSGPGRRSCVRLDWGGYGSGIDWDEKRLSRCRWHWESARHCLATNPDLKSLSDIAAKGHWPFEGWFRLAYAERLKDCWVQAAALTLQVPEEREAIASVGAEYGHPDALDRVIAAVESWRPQIDWVDLLIREETGLVPPTFSAEKTPHVIPCLPTHFHIDVRDAWANLLIEDAAMDDHRSDSKRALLVSELHDAVRRLEDYVPRIEDPGPYRKLVDLVRARTLDGGAGDLRSELGELSPPAAEQPDDAALVDPLTRPTALVDSDLEFKQDLEAQAEFCSKLSDEELEFKRDLDAQADYCNVWSDEELCEHGVTVNPVRWPEAPGRRGSERERVV